MMRNFIDTRKRKGEEEEEEEEEGRGREEEDRDYYHGRGRGELDYEIRLPLCADSFGASFLPLLHHLWVPYLGELPSSFKRSVIVSY